MQLSWDWGPCESLLGEGEGMALVAAKKHLGPRHVWGLPATHRGSWRRLGALGQIRYKDKMQNIVENADNNLRKNN